AGQGPDRSLEIYSFLGDERLPRLRMFDLDDVAIEMKHDAVTGEVLAGNKEDGFGGSPDRVRISQRAFGRHFHEGGTLQRERRGEHGRRSSAIDGFLHQV